MRRLTNFLLSITMVAFVISCEKEENQILDYTNYPDYLILDSYQIENQENFILLHNMTEFSETYDTTSTMNHQLLIGQGDFENKVAFAVIKKFNHVCNCPDMTIDSINLIDKTLVFKYNLTGIENIGDVGCDMICKPNLLILLHRDSFNSIEIYENNVLKKIMEK
ncbi:hypothetical protein [Mariniphaga sediminis]|uniref:hypothetical protein n=1 Tax=Mariniphaga sediminis TaxID=1628158 RepID=UPI003565B326